MVVKVLNILMTLDYNVWSLNGKINVTSYTFLSSSAILLRQITRAAWRRVRSIEVIQPASALPQTGKANVIWSLMKALKILTRVSQFKVDPKRLSKPTILFILPLTDPMWHRHVNFFVAITSFAFANYTDYSN